MRFKALLAELLQRNVVKVPTTGFVYCRKVEAGTRLQQVQLPELGLGRGQQTGWRSQLQDSQGKYFTLPTRRDQSPSRLYNQITTGVKTNATCTVQRVCIMMHSSKSCSKRWDRLIGRYLHHITTTWGRFRSHVSWIWKALVWRRWTLNSKQRVNLLGCSDQV